MARAGSPRKGADIYMGREPWWIPTYTFHEAALCARVSLPAIRAWALGRTYRTQKGNKVAEPLIQVAAPEKNLLSFVNVIEAHVLAALKDTHRFSIREIRTALKELSRHDPPAHPLVFEKLLTDNASFFVERLGQLVDLNRSGQLAMRDLLESHLRRIERGPSYEPLRLFPIVRGTAPESRVISVSPEVAFGRPVIAGTRIATSTIAGRYNAGDSIESIADDLEITKAQAEEAIIFEGLGKAA